jgi:DNA-binding GntR family transcriptional regulator
MMARQISAFKSKRELVYEHLRAEILQGTYKPGARIVIDELALQLGVSQIPIREALQQLQADGFVVMEPHVGPRVAEIHASLIWEVFQLLEALEVISSRAACDRMKKTEFEEMEKILRRLDTLGDNAEWSQENTHLHSSICDWAETILIKSLMNKVLDQWDRLRNYYLKDVLIHRVDLAQQEHWELFEALQARDADRVEQVIRRHNRRASRAYVEQLKATGHIENTSFGDSQVS